MNLPHVAAATLLVASLTIPALSKSTTDNAFDMKNKPVAQAKCLTRKDVLSQADVLFDLDGDELKAFHERYKAKYHTEPPEIDRLMVVNLGSPEVVLLVKFEGDCAIGMQYAPLDEFMAVLKGAPS